MRRERFGAAGAWGQCAPAALVRRGRPAPQLHRYAVPHLVRICRDAPRRDWNLYGLAGLIEIERHRKSNPPIPDWLNADYLAAWGDLEKLALRDLADASERELIQTALAVIALARGQLRLGAFLAWLDEGELAELTEDRLAWSTLYV